VLIKNKNLSATKMTSNKTRAILTYAILTLGFMGCTTAQAWTLFGPKNFDDCILENMKGVTSDQAAATIYASCSAKFPTEEKKCKLRNLSTSEKSNIRGSAKITDIGKPYFAADFYNGNSEITIDAATVTISAPNIKPSQKYDLYFSYPISPRSSGSAGISIQIFPTPDKWSWNVSIKTCSK
jgi:hypothetical protein